MNKDNLAQKQQEMKARWEHRRTEPKVSLEGYLTIRFGGKRNNFRIKRGTMEYLFEIQKGRCAICGRGIRLERGKMEDRELRAHVDHNHTTEKVRGLLCNPCNLLLGFAKENVNVLKAAIKYLKVHHQ